MSDISIDIPFYMAVLIMAAVYWPVTLGIAALLGVAAIRARGWPRIVCATASGLLVLGLAIAFVEINMR